MNKHIIPLALTLLTAGPAYAEWCVDEKGHTYTIFSTTWEGERASDAEWELCQVDRNDQLLNVTKLKCDTARGKWGRRGVATDDGTQVSVKHTRKDGMRVMILEWKWDLDEPPFPRLYCEPPRGENPLLRPRLVDSREAE